MRIFVPEGVTDDVITELYGWSFFFYERTTFFKLIGFVVVIDAKFTK